MLLETSVNNSIFGKCGTIHLLELLYFLCLKYDHCQMNGIMFINAVGHGIIFFSFRHMVYNL